MTNLKPGEKVFLSYGGDVALYCRVEEVKKNTTTLHVINGNYDITIDRVAVPPTVSRDYNEAIDWYRSICFPNRKAK